MKGTDGSLVLAGDAEGGGATARFTPPPAEGDRRFHLYAPLADQRYPDDESAS